MDGSDGGEATGCVEGTGPVVLPYPARPGQAVLAQHAFDVFQGGGHAVLEAGTGTGKTVAVLAAALAASRGDDRLVVWLTRTNAQARQVLVELRAIRGHDGARRAAGENLLAVAMQGRHHLCPKLSQDPRYAGADSEEYARLCSALKRATVRKRSGQGPMKAWVDPARDKEHEGEPDEAVLEAIDVQDAADPDVEDHRADGGTRQDKQEPVALPMADGAGCSYYEALLESDPDELAGLLANEPLDAQELAAVLEARRLCPYEAAKGLLQQARVVVAPYVYLADPSLAKAMQEWTGRNLEDCVVVVDEAHNLPDHLRDLFSAETSMEGVKRALDEAKTAGDPVLVEGMTASRFLRGVQDAMEEVLHERLRPEEEDARLSREDLLVPLLGGLGVATPALFGLIAALAGEGQKVREKALRSGRLPRSYMGSLARFLSAWLGVSPGEHVPLAQRGPSPRFVLYCLDPSIGGDFLRRVHASVHISGTLRPLDAHRDLLGLPADTACVSLPSPYERKNLRLVLVDDVTTRYEDRQRDPAMVDRLMQHVEAFAGVRGVNAMVLFPSHAFLSEMREAGLGLQGRRVFTEDPGMGQRDLVDRLDAYRRAGRAVGDAGSGDAAAGALWLGVTGGRVSEGMDFPGSTLEALCLVGVPYPKPTARQEALFQFNDVRFGKGWEYTVEAPTLRRVLQAVGRVIRDASDKGIVFLLDSRYRRWAHEFGRLERLGDEEGVDEVLSRWVKDRQGGGPEQSLQEALLDRNRKTNDTSSGRSTFV